MRIYATAATLITAGVLFQKAACTVDDSDEAFKVKLLLEVREAASLHGEEGIAKLKELQKQLVERFDLNVEKLEKEIEQQQKEIKELADIDRIDMGRRKPGQKITSMNKKSCSKSDSDAEAEAGTATHRRAKKLTTQPSRPSPCSDYRPECKQWSNIGYCSRFEAYMTQFCKISCNKCNPLNLNKDRHGKEIMDQRYPGVKQRRIFSEPVNFTRYLNALPYNAEGEAEIILAQTTWQPEYAEWRVTNVMAGIDRYLPRLRKEYQLEMEKQGKDPHRNWTSDEVDPIVIPELCRNNDRLCALWAAYGICEVKPRAMRDVCPLACHTCKRHLPKSAPEFNTSDRIGTTFFERGDMRGMHDAMWERRTVAPLIFQVDENSDGDKSSYMSLYMSQRAFSYRKIFGVDRVVERFGEESIFDDKNCDGPFSRLVPMHQFLNDEEIEEAFNFLKARGISEADGGDGMGFGPITKDKIDNPEYPDGIEVRRSAEVLITNLTSVKEPEYQVPDRSSILDAIIFKIAAKIELITGLPASSHLEAPIKFMKFEEGTFQGPRLHFGTSVNTSDPVLQKALLTYDYHVGSFPYGPLEDTLVDITPRTMSNPRVFGLTICLNDVVTSARRTVPNIEINGHKIYAEKGMALFYPTVESLLGARPESYQFREHYFRDLDRDYVSENDGTADGTYLIEDIELGMKFNNPSRQKGETGGGTLYFMQLYFRRRPCGLFNVNSDDGCIGPYSLNGRTDEDGNPLSSQDVLDNSFNVFDMLMMPKKEKKKEQT